MTTQPESKTQDLTFVVQKRAVLYARVSGDDSKTEGRGLTGQLELGREYAQANGYLVVAELAEDERKITSGADWDLPQLNRALEMARAGQFDVLITREMDRFARSLGKQLYFEHEFNRFGVTVEYALTKYEDSPEGLLSKNVRGVIAEYERLKTKERMARGRLAKVRAGKVIVSGGGPPFGYCLEDDRFVVNEDEKRIIVLIFNLYVYDGLTLQGIATKLNEMGVPLPGKSGMVLARRKHNIWKYQTISHILKNKTYTGRWTYKTAKGDVVNVEVPAIVSPEIFEAAQERLEENKRLAKRNRKREYLLSGHTICGLCNASVVGRTITRGGNTWQYYKCGARHKSGNYGHTCDLPSYFNATKVDGLVWGWLKSVMSDPERLQEKLYEYQTQQDEVYAPAKERLETIAILLEKNRQKRERWLELYSDGELSKEELKEKKMPVESAIADLEKQQAELKAEIEQDTITSEFIEDVLEFAAKIKGKLDLMDTDFEEKRWLLRALRVKVTFTVEDGEKVIYISCRVGVQKYQLTQLYKTNFVV